MNESIYYNYGEMLSYNMFINIVTGDRGGGKSFGAKELCIDSFLKDESQFLWIRRYGTELVPTDAKTTSPMYTFFDDIENFYPNNTFKIENYSAYIDDKKAGYFVPLTGQAKLKSVSLPNVKWIIFDEFIIDDTNRTNKYLRNEVEQFYNLLDTVIRLRNDVRVLMLSNAISFNNPYFNEWNIVPYKSAFNKRGFQRNKERGIIVQLWHNEGLKEAKLKTMFGKLINGSNYAKMAMDNEFYKDNDNFVEQFKTNDKKYICTLKYNSMKIGVWYDNLNKLYLFSENHEPTSNFTYAITNDDQTIDYTNCDIIKHTIMKEVKEFYKNSRVRFSTRLIKYKVMEILTLL